MCSLMEEGGGAILTLDILKVLCNLYIYMHPEAQCRYTFWIIKIYRSTCTGYIIGGSMSSDWAFKQTLIVFWLERSKSYGVSMKTDDN